jgi:hypothetical protein
MTDIFFLQGLKKRVEEEAIATPSCKMGHWSRWQMIIKLITNSQLQQKNPTKKITKEIWAPKRHKIIILSNEREIQQNISAKPFW